MQTKLMRDGFLGLFILAAFSVTGISILWIRGKEFGKGSFQFVVKFPLADGLSEGAPVRYRGVQVGKVRELSPNPNNVEITVSIYDSTLIIPKNSSIQTLESGILGNTIVQIVPQGKMSEEEGLNPIGEDCDNSKIICNGTTVDGTPGPSFTALLQESSSLLRKVNDEKILENLSATLQSTTDAARSVETLSGKATGVIEMVQNPIKKIGETLDSFGKTSASISDAAKQFSTVAQNADALILDNKQRIASTLDSISNTANETQKLIAGARPLVEDKKFIANLQVLSENAAKTAENFRKLSETANDPNAIVSLRETLDAARSTFANTQKITTDLEELTGDPKFRSDLRRLVTGLSGLVSSGNDLVNPAKVASKENPDSGASSASAKQEK